MDMRVFTRSFSISNNGSQRSRGAFCNDCLFSKAFNMEVVIPRDLEESFGHESFYIKLSKQVIIPRDLEESFGKDSFYIITLL